MEVRRVGHVAVAAALSAYPSQVNELGPSGPMRKRGHLFPRLPSAGERCSARSSFFYNRNATSRGWWAHTWCHRCPGCRSWRRPIKT